VTTRVIPDPLWAKIATAAGGLPDEARASVTEAINSYGSEAGSRVASSETRKAIGRALEIAVEFSEVIESLEQNQDFRLFKTGNKPVDVTELTNVRVTVLSLRERLVADQRRLKQRSRREWYVVEASGLVTTLLEIRTDFLRLDVPTTRIDTTKAGPFLEYVRMCVRYADAGLNEQEIDKGIDGSLRGFQQRRTFEPENFPSILKPNVKKKD
jgi:hypothetical protein